MLKLSGIVIKGKKKGKKLGFPTANILNTEKSLERGVMQVSLENFLPIGFGIVTTDNLTQA